MVKPGYKQTEIGVLPEDWECVLLLDKSKLLNGLTYTPDNVKNNGLLVLRSSNIQNNQLSLEDTLYVNCIVEDEKKIKDGDIMICVRNGSAALIGKCAQAHRDYDATFGAFMAVLRGNHNDYILQILQQGTIQKEIIKNSGATINQITNGDFKLVKIALPTSNDEEIAIASSLSNVDKLISSLEKLITKKKAIKRGTMQELLTGKRRLPGYVAPWVCKKLCDIAPLQRGFDLPHSQLEDGHIPVIFSNGINAYHRVAMVKGPGVVTGRSGTIGKLHYVDGDYWPHNTTLWVTDFKGNNPRFIYYLFHLVNWTDYMTGSGVPTLNRNDVHAKAVSIPENIEEQESIAAVLSEMDDDIAASKEKLAKYRQVKQGMMQQLLTGKIRLL